MKFEHHNSHTFKNMYMLADHIQEGIWETDPNGMTVYINQPMAELLGHSKQEMIGQSIYKFMDEAGRLQCQENLKKRLEGNNDTFEFLFYSKQGSPIWASVSTHLIYNDQQELIAMVCFLKDITKEKFKEINVEFILNSIEVGVWDWDIKNNLLVWDSNMYKLLGITPEAYSGTKEAWNDIVPHEDKIKTFGEIELAIKNKTFLETHFRINKKGEQGGVRYIKSKGHIIRDIQDNPIRMVGINYDITTQIEDKLKFKLIFENNSVGFWQWDEQKKFLNWDESQYKLFGVNPSDFSVNFDSWFQFVLEEDKDAVKEALKNVYQENSNWITSYRIKRPDSEIRHLKSRGLVNRDQNGNVNYVLGVTWDITQEIKYKKQVEEEKALRFHSAKLAKIGELAAGIGHEINNPLAILKSNLEIIKQQPGSTNSITQYLHKIENACERIENIVSGLRTYSHINNDELENVDLNLAINKTLQLIKELLKKQGFQIQYTHRPGQHCILGDFGKIQQILMNIILNAKDSLEGKDDKTIQIDLKSQEGVVTIAIKDNGVGIPDEIKNKIFDSFFTTKPIGQGSGMGLSIVKNFITSMKGEINFESEIGKGTVFLLKFPQNLETKFIPSKDSNLRKQKHYHLKHKILLIDDEDDIRQALKQTLESKGASITEAKNGIEALAILKETHFDVILTDSQMPKMTGPEFALSIEEKNIPIILMTGGTNTLSHEIRKSFSDVIYKPFTMDRLFQAIEHITAPATAPQNY